MADPESPLPWKGMSLDRWLDITTSVALEILTADRAKTVKGINQIHFKRFYCLGYSPAQALKSSWPITSHDYNLGIACQEKRCIALRDPWEVTVEMIEGEKRTIV